MGQGSAFSLLLRNNKEQQRREGEFSREEYKVYIWKKKKEKVAQQDYCLSAATFVVGAHAVLQDGITDVVEVPSEPRVCSERTL